MLCNNLFYINTFSTVKKNPYYERKCERYPRFYLLERVSAMNESMYIGDYTPSEKSRFKEALGVKQPINKERKEAVNLNGVNVMLLDWLVGWLVEFKTYKPYRII